MQPGQHLGYAFEIATQPLGPGQLTKAAPDNPATGQQHKALPGLKQFDHLQFSVVFSRIIFGLLSRTTLVGPSQLYPMARGLLRLLAQRIDLGTLLPHWQA